MGALPRAQGLDAAVGQIHGGPQAGLDAHGVWGRRAARGNVDVVSLQRIALD
ncbi:hypothetical protein D3C71_1515370 [compost metagenome]